jgi:predicted ATP-grasp superfamily ATP-dependent carboligase
LASAVPVITFALESCLYSDAAAVAISELLAIWIEDLPVIGLVTQPVTPKAVTRIAEVF